jgi:hypothetical protein
MMDKQHPQPKPQSRPSEEGRSFEHGSSGATADAAVTGAPDTDDTSTDAPYARPATPIAPDEKPDQMAERRR